MPSDDTTKRSCGSCALCCKVMRIDTISKPKLKWCPNCEIGKGCRIYFSKPDECTTFQCLWLMDDFFDDRFKPHKIKIVLYPHVHGYIIADCDQRSSMTDSKNLPLFLEIATLVESQLGMCLMVCHGNYMKAVTSNGTFDLGATRETHSVVITRCKITNSIKEVSVVPLLQISASQNS
jgi:hypothetical protein